MANRYVMGISPAGKLFINTIATLATEDNALFVKKMQPAFKGNLDEIVWDARNEEISFYCNYDFETSEVSDLLDDIYAHVSGQSQFA